VVAATEDDAAAKERQTKRENLMEIKNQKGFRELCALCDPASNPLAIAKERLRASAIAIARARERAMGALLPCSEARGAPEPRASVTLDRYAHDNAVQKALLDFVTALGFRSPFDRETIAEMSANRRDDIQIALANLSRAEYGAASRAPAAGDPLTSANKKLRAAWCLGTESQDRAAARSHHGGARRGAPRW
jgi:hypothetical protein